MDSCPVETPPPSNTTKKCNTNGCNIRIPLDYRYRRCDKCRATNRQNQKDSRARAAATAANANTSGTTSKKRRRTSLGSADGRPATRPRTDHSCEDDSNTRDDDQEDSDDDIRGDYKEDKNGMEAFSDAESFYDALRTEFKAGKPIDFLGTYPVPVDDLVSSRQRVQMAAVELWKISGYRFTVKDHKKLKGGHRTRFWCSQDETRKKKSKASQNPDIRNRDNVGMKRYPCGSKLSISCRARKDNEDELDVIFQLKHAAKHVSYEDVSMPLEALDMIRDNVEWLTPVAMVTKVQAAFPNVTAAQIHRAWMEMSEPFWRFDNDQLLSTKKLLEEHTDDVNIFEPQDIPEGVEMICWGMKKIAEPLKGKVVEIGVDATYNTNSRHLELYSIMGEHEGAGFPISYCLLSTATSIDQGKRTQALTAWAKCVRDTYGIIAQFTHVDKDMAEIGMLREVWNAKISLCWWHLRRAVRTRLASRKLSTTPYDPGRAHAEFSFINIAFVPASQADGEEYEGGLPDTISPVVPAPQQPCTLTMANGLRITIPARQPLASVPLNAATPPVVSGESEPTARDLRTLASALADNGAAGAPAARAKHVAPSTATAGKKENIPLDAMGGVQTRTGRTIRPPVRTGDAADATSLAHAMNARVTGVTAPKVAKARKATTNVNEANVDEAASSRSEDEEEEGKQRTRRTFCPARYREPIINMMEKHYCAHPLLPGYAVPTREGIRYWAVLQMYKFCVEHGLPEVWAYLWENWYRKSRWELWARSVHPEIPILKTTMILESHWRRIKHDFLHHFHMPRCDLLAWILIVKLAPSFYRKLDRLLTDTGRYRELPSWRKDFKRMWRELEKRPITLPVNPAYKTDVKRGLCTCPSLPTSRFLLCKHVVQGFEPVPPVFFLEVKRQRTAPFWVHPSLRPLSDDSALQGTSEESAAEEVMPADGAVDASVDWDDDDDDNLVDTQPQGDRRTFVEAMDEDIDLILEFAKGLKYQRQFRDQRMLQALEREGASFLRLARACLGKEKRLTSTRGPAPSTWDKSTSSAMFYRARPAASENPHR
ncbi:hypothetical protein C8R44DRAFT_887916 [Mycena epipterygia]|nr:hypothetical protein C8R44DRAFT_887916 [Mycena epipterygia]